MVGSTMIPSTIAEEKIPYPIPFGDTFKYPPKKRTSQWHIRRILYFVNHPQEIKNIELDNESSTFDILPVPIIIDGYHRWMAARYLYELGSLHKIHCLYAGREDVLDYLKGKLDTMPQEEIA